MSSPAKRRRIRTRRLARRNGALHRRDGLVERRGARLRLQRRQVAAAVEGARRPVQAGGHLERHRLRLAGFDFLMRFSHQEIEELVTPVFAHLECSFTNQPVIFDVVKTDNQFLIVNDALIVDAFPNPAEIAPRLSYYVIDSAYRKIDFLIAIHAAALGLGNGCVVFPGNCGVGKTTLSAALIKARSLIKHPRSVINCLTQDCGYSIVVNILPACNHRSFM